MYKEGRINPRPNDKRVVTRMRRKPNVKVTIHLWTDGLPDDEHQRCWDYGQMSVQVGQNPRYTVTGGNAVLFNNEDSMHKAMVTALERAGFKVTSPLRRVI
jgi:hypothetical protein